MHGRELSVLILGAMLFANRYPSRLQIDIKKTGHSLRVSRKPKVLEAFSQNDSGPMISFFFPSLHEFLQLYYGKLPDSLVSEVTWTPETDILLRHQPYVVITDAYG